MNFQYKVWKSIHCVPPGVLVTSLYLALDVHLLLARASAAVLPGLRPRLRGDHVGQRLLGAGVRHGARRGGVVVHAGRGLGELRGDTRGDVDRTGIRREGRAGRARRASLSF